MFEHLRFFCFNGSPLWSNDLILFFCKMVLLTMTGKHSVHCQTNICNFCNFWATRRAIRRAERFSPGLKIII